MTKDAVHLDALVDACAASTPDAEALRFAGASISYGELRARSARLARRLRDGGVQRGDRVGIMAHKSLEGVIAAYAVMAAGGAYVPLDPGAPDARSITVAKACGISAMIVQPRKAATGKAVSDAAQCALFGADAADWDALESGPELVQDFDRAGDDLAYILFTSGSTGTPKGIQHTHASALAFVRMSAGLYGLQPSDRVSHHAPMHFDLSIFDLYSTAYAGACCVIIPEPYKALPASLSQLMQDEQLSVWYSVPYALVQLAELGVLDKRDLSSLRWVMFGGEVMSPRHLEQLRAAWPAASFSNVYGPTETNQCTYYHVPPDHPPVTAPLPLGAAPTGTHCEILDGAQTGELIVSGPTVMRGYWNAPDLDTGAFVEHGGARWYRTGDRVERATDGTLLFHGRMDRQVKIRGHRFELGDIEHVLLNMDGVRDAAAILDIDTVAGFVCPQDGAELTIDAIRKSAAAHLPTYAVPTHIEVLDEFPRTSTGKIDRKRLTAPNRTIAHDHND